MRRVGATDRRAQVSFDVAIGKPDRGRNKVDGIHLAHVERQTKQLRLPADRFPQPDVPLIASRHNVVDTADNGNVKCEMQFTGDLWVRLGLQSLFH